MSVHFSKVLSIGTMLMGIVHIAATFTPLIAGNLALLSGGAQGAFTYFSLACGALLIMGGSVTYMLSELMKQCPSVRKPYVLVLIILVMDGVLAVVYMPHNPFAWMIFALTVGLMTANITNIYKRKHLL